MSSHQLTTPSVDRSIDKIDALTGIRIFAAVSIFVGHLPGFIVQGSTFRPFNLGGAVPLFFVLSGFILTVVGMRGRSWGDFFVARFARIWPAHVASLILLFAAFWPWSKVYFSTSRYLASLLLNIGLLQDWFPVLDIYGGYNGVSWSLSAEMFFYAVFPILVVAISRRPLVVVLAVSAVITGLLIAIPIVFPWADAGWLKSMNLIAGLFSFTIGILAGVLQQRHKHHIPKLSYIAWSAIEVACLAFAIGANAFTSEHSRTPFLGLSGLLHGNAAAPAYAFMIAFLSVSRGAISHFLSTKLMVYLGEVSFAFYLVHQIVIRCYVDRFQSLKLLPAAAQFSVLAIASLILSMMMMHFVERPARAAIVRAWKYRRSWFATSSRKQSQS